MSTGGTDVKVYTVGPNYAHAGGKSRWTVACSATRTAGGTLPGPSHPG